MWLRSQDLARGCPLGKLRSSQYSHILQRLKSLSVGSPIPKIWGKIGIGTLDKFKGSAGSESGRAFCMDTNAEHLKEVQIILTRWDVHTRHMCRLDCVVYRGRIPACWLPMHGLLLQRKCCSVPKLPV